MTLRDIMALDKKLSKAEEITLYRAYIPKDGQNINLPLDGTMLYLSFKDAVQGMLNHTEELDVKLFQVFVDTGKLPMVVIVKIIIPVKGQKNIQFLDEESEGTTFNPESGSLWIELKNFQYDLDVEEIEPTTIATHHDDKTGIITLKEFEYETLTKPKKRKK